MAANPDWQIDYFSIARYKQGGEFFRNCGNVIGLFDVDKGIEDMNTTLAALRAHEVCNGKAGSIAENLCGRCRCFVPGELRGPLSPDLPEPVAQGFIGQKRRYR